ncbi:glycine cleavage system aminomethyltransferase GcvT [Nocardioides terrisoli]|uniref:glycine cleavage system aminomethyltransferase GcvT n=1 Tax=Nocardioides terrisoli TaxID=3388267 RepID=UPI00287B5BD7|nr:glycine cleavage system aminomethyltransferase GcvT [Nocardioides marmorisolisilvae]
MSIKRSPLHERHVALGAKFSEFGGWEMPLEYPTGVVKEHNAVRQSVGIFDVSHLGKLVVRGIGAKELVNSSFTNDLERIEVGKAQYTLCCDEQSGGVVDDLIVYLKDDDHLLLVPNAANSGEVLRRLSQHSPEGVTLTDHHEDEVVIAVQGPHSDDVLKAVGLPVGHDYMSFVEAPFGGEDIVVCRTGYTGERGYELIAPASVALGLWDVLMEAGESHDMLPCGLGARDTLRTEMGYPLHGQDLSPQITPNMAGLGWAVGWKKPAFWGKDALVAEREAGTTVALRGLIAKDRAIPRPGMSVRLTRDLPIGEITSGTFSPTLRKGVGLALINKQAQLGAEVLVDVRGKPETFVVTKPPFVSTDVRQS